MLLSVGKDQGLLWDLKREELVMVFPKESANAITASFNDQNIVTVHDDGSLRVWLRQSRAVSARRDRGALQRHADVALSPDHHFLVSWNADRAATRLAAECKWHPLR